MQLPGARGSKTPLVFRALTWNPWGKNVLALEAWWALLRAAVVIRVPFGRQMVLRRAMNTGAMTRSVPCFRGNL